MQDINTIKISKNDKNLIADIPAYYYDKDSLSLIKRYYKKIEENKEDGSISIEYEIGKYYKTLSEEKLNKTTDLQSYELASNIANIFDAKFDFKIPYIHPDNILVFGSNIKIVHYGIKNLVYPDKFDDNERLKRYKALILTSLVPTIDFDMSINGISGIDNDIAKKISEFNSEDELSEYVRNKYFQLKSESDKNERLVDKNKWKALFISSGVLLALTLILSIITIKHSFNDLPLKNDVIKAQSSYIERDYSQTMEFLKDHGVASLPNEALYILARSSVNLDSLSDVQKESILNNISPSTDQTILKYWIYIGRGEFEKALDLAKNIGDSQLILHAYTNLYEAVKLDTKMDGEEKQEKLKGYEENIKDLSKKMGEKDKDEIIKEDTENNPPKADNTDDKKDEKKKENSEKK